MKIKAGLKSSEFYLSLVPTVVSMLVLTGVISVTDENMIVQLGQDIIAGVVALFSIVTYIQARRDIKITSMRSLDKPIEG